MHTVRIGAEQFRRELADLLSRVSYTGDRVIVERHGTPQAVLIPYELYEQFTNLLDQLHGQPPSEEEFERMLVAKGVIRTPNRNTTNQPPRRQVIQTKGKPLSEVILEERR
jgi:prevent-host-death family protein